MRLSTVTFAVVAGLSSSAAFCQAAAPASSVIAPMSLGSAEPPDAPGEGASEAAAYTIGLDSTRENSPVIRVIASTMGNPLLGPAIVGGAILLGVPPNIVMGIGSVGASAQQAQSEAAKRGNTDTFRYRPPAGYYLCAVRVHGVSIRPQSAGNYRPKLSAAGSREAMSFVADHSSKADTSAIKLRLDVLAVRQQDWQRHRAQCHFGEQDRLIVPLCRGRECTPHVTGAPWLPLL